MLLRLGLMVRSSNLRREANIGVLFGWLAYDHAHFELGARALAQAWAYTDMFFARAPRRQMIVGM